MGLRVTAVQAAGAAGILQKSDGSGNFADSGVLTDGTTLTIPTDVEIRNGTTVENLDVYGTYTSATSYERLRINLTDSIFTLASEKGSGGGTQRDLSVASPKVHINNGTTSNTGFRIYNSDDGAGNTEYFRCEWSGNVMYLDCQAEGTGTVQTIKQLHRFSLGDGVNFSDISCVALQMKFGAAKTERFRFDASNLRPMTSGRDLGADAVANRWDSFFVNSIKCETSFAMGGATPAIRQNHIADPTDLASCITTISSILNYCETFGFMATS